MSAARHSRHGASDRASTTATSRAWCASATARLTRGVLPAAARRATATRRARWLRDGAGHHAPSRSSRRRRRRCRSRSPRRACARWASPTSVVDGFSDEFLAGMAASASRSRRLGDVGANAPGRLALGRRGATHAAPPGDALRACRASSRRWQRRVDGAVRGRPSTRLALPADLRHRPRSSRSASPTASAQPLLDWERELRARRTRELRDYANLAGLGEFLLGYRNEYGALHRPAAARPAARRRGRDLPPRRGRAATGATSGRNGSYLVFRQLRAGRARLLAVRRPAGRRRRRSGAETLADAMVGRTPGRRAAGRRPPSELIAGVGADRTSTSQRLHLRRRPATARAARSAPTSAAPTRATPTCRPARQAALARLLRMLGFKRTALPRRPGRLDALPSPAAPRPRVRRRRSRRRRRWREPPERRSARPALHLPRRQHLAPVRVRAERLDDERQVRRPAGRERPAARQPRAAARRQPDRRLHACRAPTARRSASTGLPQFVTVRGGAYFFLPGIRALRYLAERERHDSAVSRPRPGANTGSLLRDFTARCRPGCTSSAGSSRSSARPLNRAAARAVARPAPVADQPPAPERGPGARRGAHRCPTRRRACESIIASFADYMMRDLSKPGRFERGGNTKTHGIVRGRGHRPRRPARAPAPRHLRRAPHLPGLCPLLRPRPQPARTTSTTSASCSMAIKLMGVPGPKLMDDEKHTQDLIAVSHADLRHARHARERQAADRGAFATCRSSTSSTRSTRTCSTSSCSACGTRPSTTRSAPATGAACPTCSARARR